MTYGEFIESCREKPVDDRSQLHHIIPKCMGGTNDEDNLIRLSYEDHWMAHQLLYRDYPDVEELKFAASHSLSGWIRCCYSSAAHPSKETKQKMREAKVGKKRKPFSEEHRRRMSEAHKGKHMKIINGKRVWCKEVLGIDD